MITKKRGSMVQKAPVKNSGQRQQNITAIIQEICLADPKKQNPDKDYLMILPESDIPEFGFDNVKDAEGNLTKVVKFMTTPLKEGDKYDNRREIFKLVRPVSGGAAMGIGSRIILEKSYFNKSSQTLMSYSPHGDSTKEDIDNGVRISFPRTPTCVLPEKKTSTGASQAVMVALTDNSVVIKSVEDLVELTGQMLSTSDDSLQTGTPGVQVRAYKLAPENATPEEKLDFASDLSTRVAIYSVAYQKSEKDPATGLSSWKHQTPSEFVDRLLNTDSEFKNYLGSKEWVVEFVPMLVFQQVKSRVPSNVKNNYDYSEDYRYWADDKADLGDYGIGWCLSNVIISRISDIGEVFFSTYQAPTDSYNQKVYPLDDLPTKNMPSYHKEFVEKWVDSLSEVNATRRAAIKSVYKTKIPEKPNSSMKP